METSKVVSRIILFSLCMVEAFTANAGVETSPRTDSVISISGKISDSIKIAFGESVYLAANLLDPICLLRYPDGGFGLVTESQTTDPVILGDGSYKIDLPINHFKDVSSCQFQFGFVKLWFDSKSNSNFKHADNYVVLVPTGSGYEGRPVKEASVIESISCSADDSRGGLAENLKCSFQYEGASSLATGVPKPGLTIKDLNIDLK